LIKTAAVHCPAVMELCECRLTVEEHLWIYARLKGMLTTEISAEMDR